MILHLEVPVTCEVAQAGGLVDASSATMPAAVSATSSGRVLSGHVVEYGVPAHPRGPFRTVVFAPRSIQPPEHLSRVKLLRDHDPAQPLGVLAAFDQDDARPHASYRLGGHKSAAEAAELAEAGILDGLSVGVEIEEYTEQADGTALVTRARLRETSLLALPAYDNARTTSVTNVEGAAMNQPVAAPPAPAVSTAESDAATEAAVRRVLAAMQAPPDAALLPVELPVQATSSPVDSTGRPIALQTTERHDTRFPGVLTPVGRITAGTYFAAFAQGVHEGDWSRHAEISAALVDQKTSDVPGMLPAPIVGALLGQATGRRPVWDSLMSRDMPMQGESFSRPRITQHVAVDTQAAQKTQVTSQKMTAVLDPVKKTTLAGALDIAQQAIDWTSPALLDVLISDFVARYVARTDVFAAAALVAAATGTAVTWDGKADTITGVLAEAAGNVYSALGADQDAFPNTVWLSVDQWITLAGLVDGSGRPMFPSLSPVNSTAQVDLSNPSRGLTNSPFNWVIDKNLPEGTLMMGDATLTESYENGRRFLQAVRPDVLGLDLAYMGYCATYFPYGQTLIPITPAKPTK